jgi:hypothetical protein
VAVCKLDTGYQKSVLIAQRLDANGNRLWDSLGVIIHAASSWPASDFYQPRLINSGGFFYCIWIGARNNNEGGIYIQKFDANGTVYFDSEGFPVTIDNQGGAGNISDDRGIQLLSDGNGGVVVGWLYDNLSLGPTLRADRISSSGQSQWQVNGKKLLPEERSNRFALGLHQIGPNSNPVFFCDRIWRVSGLLSND